MVAMNDIKLSESKVSCANYCKYNLHCVKKRTKQTTNYMWDISCTQIAENALGDRIFTVSLFS